MQIELSQSEVDTIQQALECWEKDAGTGELFGSLLGTMLCRNDEERAQEKIRSEAARAKAEREGKARKMKSLLIRAKLAQAITAALAG